MLSKQFRLPANVRLEKPSFSKTSLFAVKISKNNLAVNRFGFLVRKAVDKRAVARNRIRRVFRSCIEEMLGELSPGHDMLFFLEKNITEKHRTELFEELKEFLVKKKLLSQKLKT